MGTGKATRWPKPNYKHSRHQLKSGHLACPGRFAFAPGIFSKERMLHPVALFIVKQMAQSSQSINCGEQPQGEKCS